MLGSLFKKFILPLALVMTVAPYWRYDFQDSQVSKITGLFSKQVRSVFSALRDLVKTHLEKQEAQLGRIGILCQIDESMFVYKQKYHVDRVSNQKRYCFSITDIVSSLQIATLSWIREGS